MRDAFTRVTTKDGKMGTGICPVTGNACNEDISFTLVERLGDKSLAVDCCRHCAVQFIQDRNAKARPAAIGAEDFLTKVLGWSAASPVLTGPPKACTSCGSTFESILQRGQVGCPRCYECFREELQPYIAKQQYGTTHQGKVPFTAMLSSLPPQEQLAIMERTLEQAIQVEDYELASRCRDLIKRIRGEGPNPGNPG